MQFDDPLMDDEREENRAEKYFDGVDHSSLTKKRPGFKLSGITDSPVLLVLTLGVVFIILVGMIAMKLRQPGDLDQVTAMDARIKQLEDRLIDLDLLVKKISDLETREEKIDRLIKRINTLESNLAEKMKTLSQQAGTPAKTVKAAVQKKEDGPRVKTADKKAPDSGGTPVYHHVRSGDTLYSISRRYKLSIEELRRLNPTLGQKKTIYPGQKLRVQKNR